MSRSVTGYAITVIVVLGFLLALLILYHLLAWLLPVLGIVAAVLGVRWIWKTLTQTESDQPTS